MKYLTALIAFGALATVSCNNPPADPVERADSTNQAQEERAPVEAKTKENTSAFLVKAADGGLAEVAAGKIGEQKATNKAVKNFASEMVKDHTAANDEVAALASKLNISIPSAPSNDRQKNVADLGGKTAKEFDKDFMDMMVSDHKSTIDLFKDASDDDINQDVKVFIHNTIPKLEAHLAKADSIQKKIK